MCCDPAWIDEEAVVGECEDCGALVDEDGDGIGGCLYSPTCDTCGAHDGCDGSC